MSNATNAALWSQTASAQAEATTDVYGNIEVHVCEGVSIRMPLNCPVSLDIKGMNANQKQLMELLLAKAEAAYALPEGPEREAALTINVPVTMKLFKRGHGKVADATGWKL